MPMALPPNHAPVAIVAPAPECRYATKTEARVALSRMQASLPSTEFSEDARPSEICGLVRLQLANGKAVYTDLTGRYLLLTFALDTHRGSPADNSDDLEKAVQARSQYPDTPLKGVIPPAAEDAPEPGPLMSPIQPGQ
jgi:hypothetical protein